MPKIPVVCLDKNECPHEDQLLYGKAIRINKLNRVVQVQCSGCKAFGTVYEQREKHSSETYDWYEVREIWHQQSDYVYMTY